MDLSFTKDQRLIREAALEFLTKECPSDLVREMEKDDLGYPPELWSKMAELGWLGMLIPDKYEGFDGNFMDLVVLLEVMGRFLVPAPYLPTVVLGGLSILYAGSDDQKDEFLPKIVDGKLILTMAVSDKFNNPDSLEKDFHIAKEGDSFLINGTRLFVPYAHIADYIICPTRMNGTQVNEQKLSLFLIDGKSPGVSCTVMETTDSGKQCEVELKEVKVGIERTLVNPHMEKVVSRVLEAATLAQCALMVGGAEKVLEMSVAYAKKRIQFDRPIGSFQAIQHRCAEMKVDLEGAKFAVYQTAWKVDQGIPATFDISATKAWVNQACQRICAGGHQVHGGIGVMDEYDMQLYSRRETAEECFLGDTYWHREIVAQHLDL